MYAGFFEHLEWDGNVTKIVSKENFNKKVFSNETAPLLGFLCSNELKINQMNHNKQGEKYVPTTLNNIRFSFDAEKFVNKSETELSKLILDRLP